MAKEVSVKNNKSLSKAKSAVVSAFDENGNGQIDFEDIIIKGLKVPGVKIDRAKFLEDQLFTRYPKEVIDKAIAESPMAARIPASEIEKLADDVIKYERLCVSGISTALGIPGGWAMLATVPADIAQYYGYLLRATQKLLYLYGFPAIDLKEKGTKFDDGTLKTLIICMGIMNGVAGANKALNTLAKQLGVGIEKQLVKKPLTKGVIYPLVKKISTKAFGFSMKKKIFASFFKNAVPVLGALIGGAITFATFKPCCEKLKEALKDTILSNPNYVPILEEATNAEEIVVESSEIIEVEATEIDE